MRFMTSLLAAGALALSTTPASSTTTITDPITNPAGQWAGIDYFGVQVSSFSDINQLFSFTIPTDSQIDIWLQGASQFTFTDILLNGQSIASNFTLGNTLSLLATGYAQAGAVSLTFVGSNNCASCWDNWFGGYVQVTEATIPTTPVSQAVPEPASWLMMIVGLGAVGALMRRPAKRIQAL